MKFNKSDFERRLLGVFENGNPIQKAVILICGKRNGLTLRAMARMVSLSDGTVRNLISLRQLPFADQSQIAAGASYRSYLTKVRDIKVERKESKQTRKELARVRARRAGDEDSSRLLPRPEPRIWILRAGAARCCKALSVMQRIKAS